MQEAVNCDHNMGLRQQQQQWDEERADKEREASHLHQDQVTSNGYKVSVVTPFSQAST